MGMRIVTDGRAALARSVIVLGMFDGVHIGHQVLLERAKVLAKRSNVPLVACTFTGHPLAQIAPDRCPPALTTFRERAVLLEKAGVDLLFAQPFTEEMRQMPPEVYVGELMRRFHPTDIVCGYNHTFGKDGSGTSALLAALGDALGFRTEVVPQITLAGEEVSSSAIRAALSRGDLHHANRLLGHPYGYSGTLLPETDGRYGFAPEDTRKQPLPAGKYRCLLSCGNGGKSWPCTAAVAKDGKIRLGIAAQAEEQTAQLLFLENR